MVSCCPTDLQVVGTRQETQQCANKDRAEEDVNMDFNNACFKILKALVSTNTLLRFKSHFFTPAEH